MAECFIVCRPAKAMFFPQYCAAVIADIDPGLHIDPGAGKIDVFLRQEFEIAVLLHIKLLLHPGSVSAAAVKLVGPRAGQQCTALWLRLYLQLQEVTTNHPAGCRG